MANFTVHHTLIGERPFWYRLDPWGDQTAATTRARCYALDHGGYVCVKDDTGKVIYGTDPVELDRAITAGINKYFSHPSAQAA